jgi:hypothetical protein
MDGQFRDASGNGLAAFFWQAAGAQLGKEIGP